MIETIYRGLPEFGLPLITPGDPGFDAKVEQILRVPMPFGRNVGEAPERAAVLENRTESAIVTWGYVWRYTGTGGATRTSRGLNLGSGGQMDVLTGREKARRDLTPFFLPGSKRLITEDAVFGDNRDVLGPPAAGGGGGMAWAGARMSRGRTAAGDAVRIELEIDVAIFEDGLCVGPDESGLRESLTEQMQLQRDTAGQIVRMLRDGSTPGQIFEILRLLARMHPPEAPASPGAASHRHHRPLLSMFANSAVRRLINADESTLLSWFEAAADISPLPLHPPSRPRGNGDELTADS